MVVESSKKLSPKLLMASPNDSDSNSKQKEIDYQCYNFEPTYLPTILKSKYYIPTISNS